MLPESLPRSKNFPVVCIGGSAGGLDAFSRFLQHIPSDTGMAIVIVNHMRSVPTQLHQILPRYTTMPVHLITENLAILPNQVFIIPENRDLHIDADKFILKPLSKPRGWPDVITIFLRSLARHWDGKLIAVIVSGMDSDGVAALGDIKQIGGITIAQRPDTAIQSDMPDNAIASGCIDFILTPEQIGKELVRLCAMPDDAQQSACFNHDKAVLK
ncbi:MAG: chemotaxis protein CheB [Pseudomonadota bacterium]